MIRKILGLLLLATAATSCGGGGGNGPRHVLLISLDTTRSDRLGCYGAEGAATPIIDRLAAEGVLFRHAVAPAPSTLPSHTSLMTGSWPHTHGVPRNGYPVHEDNVMLAELLGDAGFHTAAFLGSFVLNRRFQFDQGFDHFDEEYDQLISGDNYQNQRSAGSVTEAVLRHLDTVDEDRLFVFAHYFDAHVPYTPPEDVARRFVSSGEKLTSSVKDVLGAVLEQQGQILPEPPGLPAVNEGGLPPRLIREARGVPLGRELWLAALYDAEVSAVDEAVGALLTGYEERGLLDDTLVIVTGDHGETFWEHGDFWNHGLMVYETTVGIPLIVRFPGGEGAGTVVEDPVSTVDLVPTLCELLGLRLPSRVEGESLVPALRGTGTRSGYVFSEATSPSRVHESPVRWTNQLNARCVRAGNWKYVRIPYLRMEQLFDLENDPHERNDLLRNPLHSAEVGAKADELRDALGKWEAMANPLPSSFDSSQNEEVLERLRELGYTQAR